NPGADIGLFPHHGADGLHQFFQGAVLQKGSPGPGPSTGVIPGTPQYAPTSEAFEDGQEILLPQEPRLWAGLPFAADSVPQRGPVGPCRAWPAFARPFPEDRRGPGAPGAAGQVYSPVAAPGPIRRILCGL